MCDLLWLTWPELALTRVMWVATRVAVVPPHRPSRGAPPACTRRPTTAPHGGWLVPEYGRLPAPLLYWDFTGEESGPGGLGWNPQGMP